MSDACKCGKPIFKVGACCDCYFDLMCPEGLKLLDIIKKEKTCGFCKINCQNDWCPTKDEK